MLTNGIYEVNLSLAGARGSLSSFYRPNDRKILIVDDDLQVRQMLAIVLSKEGFETETASDGFEAGVKAVRFQPGLFVLALFMPGMDGFETCRRLKTKLPGQTVKPQGLLDEMDTLLRYPLDHGIHCVSRHEQGPDAGRISLFRTSPCLR